MELRPYQREAVDAVCRELAKHRSTLLVAPTGTGKTIVFAALADLAKRGRVLVLAHREELVRQAADKIHRVTGKTCGVEMAGESVAAEIAQGALIEGTELPIIIASVATISRPSRLDAFAPDAFSLVVIDECQHSVATSYRSILDYFSGAKVCGVTATPDRLDGALMAEVFDSAAFVYEIRDAIRDGWLVPVRQKTIALKSLDLSQVKVSKRTKDFDSADLELQLATDACYHEVAAPLVELAGARPTLVFCAGVASAHGLAAVLQGYVGEGNADALDGTTPKDERREIIRRFHDGEMQYLCNCMVLTEGFDAPAAACVAVVRPTQSRALYAQMCGRGLRILGADIDESVALGKPDCLVLDFVGNAYKHSLVCVTDVLDGGEDARVSKHADKLRAGNPDLTVNEALDLAEEQVAELRRLAKIAPVDAREVDPFRVFDAFTVLGASSRAGRWAGMPPSDRQLQALLRFGVSPPAGLDKGQASALLDKLCGRADKGLCTYKMARLLAKYGLNPDLTFEAAHAAIDAIAENRWSPPGWLLADSRYRLAPSGENIQAMPKPWRENAQRRQASIRGETR